MGQRNMPKRDKVYCDKWVHEGICAFTQQGCRFKHEMPEDAATLRMLGLFHGPPAWWTKLQREQARPMNSAELDVPVTLTQPNAYGGQIRNSRPEGHAGQGAMTRGTPRGQNWDRQTTHNGSRGGGAMGSASTGSTRQPHVPTSEGGFRVNRVGKTSPPPQAHPALS